MTLKWFLKKIKIILIPYFNFNLIPGKASGT